MALKLEAEVSTRIDQASVNATVGDVENSFKGLGEKLSDNLSDGIVGFTKGTGKTIKSSLGASILDGVTSGLDSLGSIWESAWQSLGKSAKNSLANALGGLVVDGIGSLFSNTSKTGSTANAFWTALGFGKTAKDSKESGSLSKNAYNALFGKSTDPTAGQSLPDGIFSWIGEELPSAEVAASEALPDGLFSWIGDGGIGSEAAEGIFGLSSGATAALAVAAPFAVGELASMLGLMEGPSPLTAIFGGGGGHTKESAQETITANMEYLAGAAQVLQSALEGANTGATNFATTMMTQMSGSTLEMGRLAERAGMSREQIDAMVEALDPASAKLIEASESVGLINEKIDAMDNVLELSTESFYGANSAGSEFQDMLLNMAASLNLPAESSDTLAASIKSLIAQWNEGQISAETLSSSLKTSFTNALTDLATQTTTTTDQMRELSDSIESIPTEWTSTINVVYNTVGNPPTYQHSGGLLMHDGGWLGGLGRYHSGARVSALFNDEVPLIAQRGEFIVRRDSVNATTLPLLKALNQSGNALAAQPQQVNLHLEVHGNLMGDESAFNDLARLLEAKLRDLDQARYAA